MATKNGIPEELRRYIDLDNIAPELGDQQLTKIAGEVIEKATKDEESRYEWKVQYNQAMKIAKQVIEAKNTPWQGAANIKYPLILSACIQFNARILPEVVQGTQVVNIVDLNEEETDEEDDRIDRIESHMSWQCLEQIDNWYADTDRILMVLPMAGVIYRKSYFDPIDKKPAVDFCLPEDIIINNGASSLENAQAITHVLHLTDNQMIERMRAELFIDYPLSDLQSGQEEDNSTQTGDDPESEPQEPNMHVLYEQHTWLDLDEDGYKEPYIVTVHKEAGKVLRIVARYDKNSFVYSKSNKFIKINPIQYFTDYHFMPSPDGGFHSMGFGKYLYPINEAVNTVLNQMLDAATLQNRGGGFITRTLRTRKREIQFKMGEYTLVDCPAGTTLSQNFMQFPTPGPAPVLFSLLQLLIKSGEELASISDVMQGQAPAANTTAHAVMSLIEQGTKVYSSMLNRLHASFKNEFEKLFEINKKYLDVEEKFVTNKKAMNITLSDYKNAGVKVFPVIDPSISSDAHRAAKSQALMQIAENPNIDSREVYKRYLKALKIPNPEKIMPEPDPNAPPPMQEQLAEAELKLKNMQVADIPMKRELEALRLNKEEQEVQIEAAYKGAVVAGSKIDSIVKLAQMESMVGTANIEHAQKEFDLIQAKTEVVPETLEQTQGQLQQFEAAQQNQNGQPIPAAPQPMQAASPNQGPQEEPQQPPS